MPLASASFFTTRCLSLPDLRKASSFAESPLYFSALFLNDGPSLSEDTAWHLRQPSFFAAASPDLASCACATNGIGRIVAAIRTLICLMVLPPMLIWDKLEPEGSAQNIGPKSYGTPAGRPP